MQIDSHNYMELISAMNNPRGRNNGRGGRSGRGHGRSNGRRNSNGNKSGKGSNSGSTTKLELKFAPHNPGKGSTATYATVKEHIVEGIQKSHMQAGVDVSKSLKKMKWIDFDADEPVRIMSELDDADAKREEQEFLDRMHQEKYGCHLD